jgi:hypothetical protein
MSQAPSLLIECVEPNRNERNGFPQLRLDRICEAEASRAGHRLVARWNQLIE